MAKTTKKAAKKVVKKKKTEAPAKTEEASSPEKTASKKRARDPREDKAEDARQRIQDLEKQNITGGLDANDPRRGWDAQQGGAPDAAGEAYSEDPVRYTQDQLPNFEAAMKAGFKPPYFPDRQRG